MQKIVLSLLVMVFLLKGYVSPNYCQAQQDRKVRNRFPDIQVTTNDGSFELSNLSSEFEKIYIGGKPWTQELCLSATLRNRTDTTWNFVSFSVQIVDITGQAHSDSIYFSGNITPNSTMSLEKDVLCTSGKKRPGYHGEAPKSISATFESGTYPITYTFAMTKPIESSDLRYEDDKMKILFIPSSGGINFTIENKMDEPIKIDWNQVAFIDSQGSSSKTMHSGVRFIEKDSSLPPTIVPPTAKVTDVIVPISNISYDGGRYGSGWSVKPLFPETGPEAEALQGTPFGVFMPIEVNSKMKNYMFKFQIVTVKKK